MEEHHDPCDGDFPDKSQRDIIRKLQICQVHSSDIPNNEAMRSLTHYVFME